MKCAWRGCLNQVPPKVRRSGPPRRYCSDDCRQREESRRKNEPYIGFDKQHADAKFLRFRELLQREPDLETWQLAERLNVSGAQVRKWRVDVRDGEGPQKSIVEAGTTPPFNADGSDDRGVGS